MPLLETNRIHHISASVRLDESTAEQVDRYAALVHASADDVVDKALSYVFSKDRDFQDFLKTPQAKQVLSRLRVRKGPSNGATDEPAKKLVAGVEHHGFCASGDGVIQHSIWCRSRNGASHRKNCDTPPPTGSGSGSFGNLMRSAMTRKNLLKRGNLLLSPSSRENEAL